MRKMQSDSIQAFDTFNLLQNDKIKIKNALLSKR